MIAIRINRTHWLQLPGDIELDINRVSPVFSEDKVFEQNSVYNFTVPYTPANAEALGYPKRAMALMPPTKNHHIEIYFNNNIVAEGTAFVSKSGQKSIEIVSALNESSFYSLFGDKYITEFSYGGNTVFHVREEDDPLSFTHIADSAYPDNKFAYFPVRNTELYNGTTWAEEYALTGRPGYFDEATGRMYQNDYILLRPTGPGNAYYVPNVHTITPFPYVGHVVEEIFKECGYGIANNVFRKDNRLQRLCIYNPNVEINNYHDSLIHNIGVNTANHLPKLKVSEFFMAIKTPFATNFIVNEITRMVEINTFNNACNDERHSINCKFIDESFETQKKLRIKNKVDSGDSYCKDVLNPDELEKYNYIGEFFSLSNLQAYPTPIEGDLALVFDSQYFYKYDYDNAGVLTWIKFVYSLTNREVGDFEESVDINLDFTQAFCESQAVKNPYVAPYCDDVWDVPTVNMAGNHLLRGMQPSIGYNDFGLKLMFYWGKLQTEVLGLEYPVGSSTVYQGKPFSGTSLLQTSPLPALSLFPNHDKNFVDAFLSRHYQSKIYKRVRKVKTTMRISELQEIDFLRTILLDGRLWLITKVNFKLSNKGVSPVDMELTEIN